MGILVPKPMLGRQLRKGHRSTRGLAGLWLFNEGSGNIVSDLSGNNNAGMLTGPIWQPGKYGSILFFTQAYIRADSVWNQFPTNNTAFTIIVWIRPDNVSTNMRYVEVGNGSVEANVPLKTGFRLLSVNNDLYGQTMDGDRHSVIASGVLVRNVWQQVAFVYDGNGNMELYRNDISVATAGSGAWNRHSEVWIGIQADQNVNSDYVGLMDIPMIYNRALNASERTELYLRPFAMFERKPLPLWTAATQGVVGENFVRTIDDSVGLTDAESLVKEIYRTFDESMGVTDVKAKVSNSIRIVAESLGITDTFSKEEAKVISESLGITDAVSRTSVILRTLVESLGITDSVSEVWVAIRTLAESLGITDTVTKDFGNLQVIDDSMGLTDTTSKIHIALRTLSESLGLADDVARVFVVSRIISDTEGITDGLVLQRMMTVADTLGITDDVTRLIDYLRIEDDDVGLLDSMVRVSLTLRTIDDDVEITDEVSAQLGALLKAVWAFVVMRQTHN